MTRTLAIAAVLGPEDRRVLVVEADAWDDVEQDSEWGGRVR